MVSVLLAGGCSSGNPAVGSNLHVIGEVAGGKGGARCTPAPAWARIGVKQPGGVSRVQARKSVIRVTIFCPGKRRLRVGGAVCGDKMSLRDRGGKERKFISFPEKQWSRGVFAMLRAVL